jgi:hypothetical protein
MEMTVFTLDLARAHIRELHRRAERARRGRAARRPSRWAR